MMPIQNLIRVQLKPSILSLGFALIALSMACLQAQTRVAMNLNDNDQAASQAVSSATIQKQLQEANEQFKFQGKPISPSLLLEFGVDELGDRTHFAVAIALADLTDEHDAQFNLKLNDGGPKGHVSASFGKEGGVDQQAIGYRRLGRLANGTHVLMTDYSGGGTGIFMSLLLVKFVAQQEYTEDGVQPRILVMKMGEIALGDRYNGKVTVAPKSITIGPGNNHEERKVINFE